MAEEAPGSMRLGKARHTWLSDPSAYAVAPSLTLQDLDAVASTPRLAVQLLYNRGINTPAAVRSLLDGDWHDDRATLPDMEAAFARLMQARETQECVTVWGDYDCDGMTSCALLTEVLLFVGIRARPFVAVREDDGRGLNLIGVEALAREGVRLIVTTDCGTANVAEIELAKRLGVDVIVTDHHPLHGDVARPLALVNPRRGGDDEPATDLAGVGVALRLAYFLLERVFGRDARAQADALLDLVAIGTVADVAPLTRQNWLFVRAGLQRLNGSPRPGLRALLRSAGIQQGEIGSRDIAFSLAPRLNACGRLGDPSLAIELLLCRDEMRAAELAARVEALHQRRQGMTEELYARANKLAVERTRGAAGIDLPRVVVAVDDDLPLGLIGLVAGRLSEDLGRAVFVVSREGTECRGSGRAPAGYDLGGLLAKRADLFKRFGGHAQAAGFTIATERLDELLAFLDTADTPAPADAAIVDARRADDRHKDDHLTQEPKLNRIDCILPLRRLVPENVQAIRDLEPYGAGFSEPLFLAPRVWIVRAWRSGQGGKTLRLRLREGGIERTAIWLKHGELYDQIAAALPSRPNVNLVYSVGTGRQPGELTLRIQALLPPEE